MTDDAELAEIRNRDAYFEKKEHMEVYCTAFDAYAIRDRRILLRRLDEALNKLQARNEELEKSLNIKCIHGVMLREACMRCTGMAEDDSNMLDPDFRVICFSPDGVWNAASALSEEVNIETAKFMRCERDALAALNAELAEELRKCTDMLRALAGDIEDGIARSLVHKVISAIDTVEESARAALKKNKAGTAPSDAEVPAPLPRLNADGGQS